AVDRKTTRGRSQAPTERRVARVSPREPDALRHDPGDGRQPADTRRVVRITLPEYRIDDPAPAVVRRVRIGAVAEDVELGVGQGSSMHGRGAVGFARNCSGVSDRRAQGYSHASATAGLAVRVS